MNTDTRAETNINYFDLTPQQLLQLQERGRELHSAALRQSLKQLLRWPVARHRAVPQPSEFAAG